jgi:hypothetical protein
VAPAAVMVITKWSIDEQPLVEQVATIAGIPGGEQHLACFEGPSRRGNKERPRQCVGHTGQSTFGYWIDRHSGSSRDRLERVYRNQYYRNEIPSLGVKMNSRGR